VTDPRQLLRAARFAEVAATVPTTLPAGATARLPLGDWDAVAPVAARQLEEARSQGDERQILAWLEVRCQLAWLFGRSRGLQASARDLLQLARPGTDDEVTARLWLGTSMGLAGDLLSWARHLDKALSVAESNDDPWLVARVQLALGACNASNERGAGWLDRARAGFDSDYWRARCDLPGVMARRLDPPEAQAQMAAVASTFAAYGDRVYETYARIGEARQLRLLGRLDDALAASRVAVAKGSPMQRVLGRYGEARVHAMQGDVARSDELYRALFDDPHATPTTRSMIAVHSLPEAARRGDLAGFDRRMAFVMVQRVMLHEDLWEALDACRDAGLERRRLLQLAAFAYDQATPELRHRHADTLLSLAGPGLPVGPLVLTQRLGRGGMASVWKAVDVRRPDDELAVKMLRLPPGADGLAVARRFRRELQALASLPHPHIQPVLDFGLTGASVGLLSGGELQEGVPGLAMPLARGGTLRALCGRLPWAEVHQVMTQVLSGLAAAHAHGVLHLDLKPDNVLLVDEGPPWVARLADFGLARAVGEVGLDELVGTPKYMAPEQFQGEPRAWGPPTDLYAVGCLLWALVCGAPPYDGSPAELRARHLAGVLPPFRPVVPVPEDLHGWLSCALSVSVRDRFVDAPAALRAFEALGPPLATASDADAPRLSGAVDTFAFDLDLPAPLADDVVDVRPSASSHQAVEVPQHWVEEEPSPVPSPELLRYRSAPLVGRHLQQRALWDALIAASSGSPRAVWLRTEPGHGGGRIVQWLAHQVRLLGVATVWSTRCAPTPLQGTGLGGLATEALAAGGLQGTGLERWLRRSPWRPSELSLADAREALEADELPERLLPLLAAHAARRPVVLLVEQAHHLEAFDRLLERVLASSWPVLAVMTSPRDELSDPRQQRLSELGVDWLEVGALSDDAMVELVEGLLPIERVQRDALVRRCAGQPGRLVGVLKRWARENLLDPTESGRYRVPQVLLEDSDPDIVALPPPATPGERAMRHALAVLGGQATEAQLERTVKAAGHTPDLTSLRAHSQVRFADGVVRLPGTWVDTLRLQLRETGTLSAWHRAAAEALERVDGVASEGFAALRAGRHHRLGGQPLRAAAALRRALTTLEPQAAAPLWPEWEGAMAAAGVPDDDPRWLDGWTDWLEGRLHRQPLQVDRALRRRADRVLAAGDPRQRAVARLAAAMMDDDPEARRTAWREVGASEGLPSELRAHAWLHLAHDTLHAGDGPVRARVLADRARGLLSERHPLLAAVAQLQGKVAHQLGDLPTAEARLREALAFGEAGVVGGRLQLYAWSALGDVHRQRGDLDAAERCYRSSWALSAAYIDSHRHIDELNLVLVDAERGRLALHADRLPGLIDDLRSQAPLWVFAALLQLALPGRSARFEQVLATIEAELDHTGWCDVELAHVAELVARSLLDQQRPEQAARLHALAAAQREAIRARSARAGAPPAS
jgi:serine/threonine protein kinase/tetratricopeptide (TPR) repeat protein